MLNYTICQKDFNHFFDVVSQRRYKSDKYIRISRKDLSLFRTRFYVLTTIRQLANFQTRIVDYAKQRRYLRYHRCRRTVDRHLSGLTGRYMARLAPNVYRIHKRPQERPINLYLTYTAIDPVSALFLQFYLLLAFWPRQDRHWQGLTTRAAREALGCDMKTAAMLVRWLRANGQGISQRALRRQVFITNEPRWFWYVKKHDQGGQEGGQKKNLPCYENVIPEVDQYDLLLKRDLTSSVHGPPWRKPNAGGFSLRRDSRTGNKALAIKRPPTMDLSHVSESLAGIMVGAQRSLAHPAFQHSQANNVSSVRNHDKDPPENRKGLARLKAAANLKKLLPFADTLSENARKLFFPDLPPRSSFKHTKQRWKK